MPITSATEARSDIFALFEAAWTANTPAITGTAPQILWQNVEEDDPPPSTNWVLASVTHVTGGHAAIGNKFFQHEGLFAAQIYVARGEQAMGIADALVQVVLDAFEGQETTNGVWFRDARINEAGAVRDWYQINVIVDFTYFVSK